MVEHQFQQGSINTNEELHHRVTHWAKLLRVSHSELARYIMNKEQLPGARLSLPAPGEFVSTPLQYVCEVRATGYNTSIEDIPDWPNDMMAYYWKEEVHTTDYPTLDARIIRLVLPNKQEDLEDPQFRPTVANVWVSVEPKVQREAQKPSCYLRTFNCQRSFGMTPGERGLARFDEAVESDPEYFRGLDQTAMFVGSNRMVGVFDRRIRVQAYDRIYTVAGVGNAKRALIVRGDSRVGLWKTIGCALLLRQESRPWLEWYNPVLHKVEQAISPKCPDGEALPQDPDLDVTLSCSVAHAHDVLRYLSPETRYQVEPSGNGDSTASNDDDIEHGSHIDNCRYFSCMQEKEWNRTARDDTGPERLKNVRKDSVTDVVEHSEV
ncbi:hypothetical protein M3J07_007187 [Ascochyta lentis]